MKAEKPPLNPLIAFVRTPWRDLAGCAEARLLRLSLLRELARDLHARVSRIHASSPPEAGQELAVRILFEKVEALRDLDPLPDDLDEALRILENLGGQGGPERAIPQALLEAIGEQRLTRDDRKWEHALVAEAGRLGWGFWELESDPDPSEAQAFHEALSRSAGDHAIVLFVESANRIGDEIWRGRWLIAVHPQVKTPSEIFPAAAFRRGTRWRRIFPA